MVSTKKKVGAKKKAVAKKPMVSIVMPAYNAAHFIDDAIHSVLGQTFGDFELIIVDDHSSDNTLEVVDQFKSDKIRVIKCARNTGAINATNRGIREARGRYLAFIDANDLWQPNKLVLQIDAMHDNDAAFVFASYVYADAKGRPNGRVVRMPSTISADKNGLIMTSTVILDMTKLTKNDVKMEKGEKKWRRVIGIADGGYGMREVMAIRGYDSGLSFLEKVRRGVR